jgi:hypothetical protein
VYARFSLTCSKMYVQESNLIRAARTPAPPKLSIKTYVRGGYVCIEVQGERTYSEGKRKTSERKREEDIRRSSCGRKSK